MSNLKRIFILNVFFILLIAATGCNTVDTTVTEQIVQVQIIDTYYKAPYNTIIESVPQRHAAVYRVTVEYNGKEYDITGMDAYNKCSEKIGETVEATAKKTTNGTYEIINIK
jgi:hypothetical protein